MAGFCPKPAAFLNSRAIWAESSAARLRRGRLCARLADWPLQNQDIDLVVEGDGIGFARALAAELGGRVREHRKIPDFNCHLP